MGASSKICFILVVSLILVLFSSTNKANPQCEDDSDCNIFNNEICNPGLGLCINVENGTVPGEIEIIDLKPSICKGELINITIKGVYPLEYAFAEEHLDMWYVGFLDWAVECFTSYGFSNYELYNYGKRFVFNLRLVENDPPDLFYYEEFDDVIAKAEIYPETAVGIEDNSKGSCISVPFEYTFENIDLSNFTDETAEGDTLELWAAVMGYPGENLIHDVNIAVTEGKDGWISKDYDIKIIEGECGTGPCCDLNTCSFKDSSEICQESISEEIGCPWGDGQGKDVGIKFQDRYCSGYDNLCTGSAIWKDWEIKEDCNEDEFCDSSISSCKIIADCYADSDCNEKYSNPYCYENNYEDNRDPKIYVAYDEQDIGRCIDAGTKDAYCIYAKKMMHLAEQCDENCIEGICTEKRPYSLFLNRHSGDDNIDGFFSYWDRWILETTARIDLEESIAPEQIKINDYDSMYCNHVAGNYSVCTYTGNYYNVVPKTYPAIFHLINDNYLELLSISKTMIVDQNDPDIFLKEEYPWTNNSINISYTIKDSAFQPGNYTLCSGIKKIEFIHDRSKIKDIQLNLTDCKYSSYEKLNINSSERLWIKAYDNLNNSAIKEIKYEPICYEDQDCPESYWGKNYCIGKELWKEHIFYECNNPGTGAAYCNPIKEDQIIEICEKSCTPEGCIQPDPPNECIENWKQQFKGCTKKDKRLKYYTDENSCNTSKNLPEDNNTYVFCDYCTPDWQCDSYGPCSEKGRKCNKTWDPKGCYLLTNLSSDDYQGNFSEFEILECEYKKEDEENENEEKDYKNITINLKGNISGINLKNISITIEEKEEDKEKKKNIIIKENNDKLIEFNSNSSELDLSKITIQKQDNNSSRGFIRITGIDLSEGYTKTAYIDNIKEDADKICIVDKEIISIEEFPDGCSGEDIFSITCNNSPQKGYSCYLNNSMNRSRYKIEGLKHSFVFEYKENSISEENIYNKVITSSSGSSSGKKNTGSILSKNKTKDPIPTNIQKDEDYKENNSYKNSQDKKNISKNRISKNIIIQDKKEHQEKVKIKKEDIIGLLITFSIILGGLSIYMIF